MTSGKRQVLTFAKDGLSIFEPAINEAMLLREAQCCGAKSKWVQKSDEAGTKNRCFLKQWAQFCA